MMRQVMNRLVLRRLLDGRSRPTTGRIAGAPVLLLLVAAAALIIATPALAHRAYVETLTGTPTGTGGAQKPFEDPRSLAVDDSTNDLWISDSPDRNKEETRIDEFSPSGGFIAQGSGEGGKPGPISNKNNSSDEAIKEWTAEYWEGISMNSIAFSDAAGNLDIFEDAGENQIWAVEAASAYLSKEFFPIPGFFSKKHTGTSAGSGYIAVDNSSTATKGDVYVAWPVGPEWSGGRPLYRMEGEGTEGKDQEERRPVPAPFSYHAAYITGEIELGTRVENGNNDVIIGTPTGPGGEVQRLLPKSVAVDPATGNFYVSTGAAIDVFESSGKFVEQITEAGGHPLEGVGALAVDPASDHLLAAVTGPQVDEFSLSSGKLELLSEPITEANGASLGGIESLAVNSSGDLYIAEGSGKKVYELGPYKSTKYKLEVNESGSGSGEVISESEPPESENIKCPSKCSVETNEGDKVTLTADAAPGSKFKEWSGACSGTETTCKVTMTEAKSVTATFETEPRRELRVEVLGTGSGTVTSEDAQIDCHSGSETECSGKYVEGATETLKATADPGSTFAGWSHDSCITESEPALGEYDCVVKIESAPIVTVTATFAPKLVTLEVQEPGFGSGTVTSAPAGIDCPGALTCAAQFDEDHTVTLTEQAASGSSFTGWEVEPGADVSSGCTGKEATCTVTMDGPGPVRVTATFGPNLSGTLEVNVSGDGTVGTREGGVSGPIASCTSACSAADLREGAQVTLTELPGAHQRFAGWQVEPETAVSAEGCSYSRPCTVTMNGPVSVTAKFEPILETLQALKDGAGTVSSSPAGIACGATCSASFEEDTPVTLTATPEPGSTFTGWSGCEAESEGKCEIAPAAAASVTATFAAVPKEEKTSPSTSSTITATIPTTVIETPKPPSNHFTVKIAAVSTTATLRLTLPDPGTVTAAGKDLKSAHANATSAGTITLKLPLTAAAAKTLKQKGKLKLQIAITFKPTGGTANTITEPATFTIKTKKKTGGKKKP